MVGVRLTCLLWLLCLTPLASYADQPRLQIVLDKATTELGVPVHATLYGFNLPFALNEISLAPWEQDFGVVSAQEDTSRDNPQTLSIKLYPRRMGSLTIPSLSRDGLKSNRARVTVRAPLRGGVPISVQAEISGTKLWTRQQILVRLEVRSIDRFFSLETDAEPMKGFRVIPLATERQHEPGDNGPHTVARIGWALFPLTSGKHTVVLPPVRYVLNGTTQRTFYLPRYDVVVRALPSYIPPTIPVGKVEITSELSPSTGLRTGSLAYWNLMLHGSDVPASDLPPILRQIHNNPGVHFFPAETRRENRPDYAGVQGEVRHRIPLKPLSSGRLALPTLRVQYFDPGSGRLVTVQHQPATPWAISSVWRFALGASGLLLLGWFTKTTFGWLRRVYHHRQAKLHAYRLIQQAADYQSLRRGLQTLSAVHGWPANHTLSRWLSHWQRHYEASPDLSQRIADLTECLYGRSKSGSIVQLRNDILSCIRRPRRRRRLRFLAFRRA